MLNNCPMKLPYSQKVLKSLGQRGIIILATVALAGWGLTSTRAQLQSLKRITAVQLGRMDSGSRVSVFADSALNDYEAFRRGDRFYVKLPRAAFATGRPSFTGTGFQDIQVQEAN